jgi:hypothetical protein
MRMTFPTIRGPGTPAPAKLLVALLAALLALSVPATGATAELRRGDSVFVGPDQTIDDDLYAFGNSVTVLGTVNGDLISAGNTITMGGRVNGNVWAASNDLTVSGEVLGTLRAAGNTVRIAGPVGKDVFVGANTLSMPPTARLGRDLFLGARAATVAAPVGRNLFAGAGDVTIAAPVAGNVNADVSALHLGAGTAIQGRLFYRSEGEVDMAPGAIVQGPIERGVAENRRDFGSRTFGGFDALGWLRALVGLSLLGLLVVLLFPGAAQSAADTIRASPWSSLGLGFVLLVGVPMLAIMVFVAGLFVGGWWLALMLLALYAISATIGYVIAAEFVGRLVLRLVDKRTEHLVWGLLLGLVLLGVIGQVPFLGGLATFAALVFGLGALALAASRAYPRPSTSTTPRTPPTPIPTEPMPA